jgi:hypothetical protein
MGRRKKEEEDDIDLDELDRKDVDDEDEDDEDGETLKELDVDENGHVIEGRRRKRSSRDDEYEEDFDYEERNPAAYGYEETSYDD